MAQDTSPETDSDSGGNPIPGLLPLLRRLGRIAPSHATRAAEIERMPPGRHEAALLAEGIVSEEDIAQAVAQDAGLPFEVINPLELNPEVVTGTLPAPFARRHTICALSKDGDTLKVAVANPADRSAIADLERYLGLRVTVVVATRSDIEGINGSLYNLRTSLRAAETELTHEHGAGGGAGPGTQEFVSASEVARDLEPTTRPVVAALDSILHQAFEQRASDIHLEPKRDRAVVRFRVDGVLRTMHTFPRIVYQAVVSRLKMLSGLDIAEKRRPQDGRFKRIEPDKEIELRVSTLPTIFGEKAVLRVFDPAALVSSLEQLKLADDEETRLRDMLNRREGLVLVTGPTGSGKTTTLYTVLRHVATAEVNVVTIEDPVELIYPPLSQVQVNPRIHLTFAAAIRSVLRQDPDIVMVGEIRDGETAEMAVQAALTGHLVLSTLHTNDASGAITRLADLGVPRFLIGSTLVGVVAQRLVRVICSGCPGETVISVEEARTLAAPELEGKVVRRGQGCARCRDTGYRGRRGVFEILPIDPRAAAEILGGCTAEDLARTARRRGVLSLRQAALRVLLDGQTTTAEVIRVTGAGQDPDFGREGPMPPARLRSGSVTESPADHQQQRRNPVEDEEHVADRGHPAPHRDVGEPARTLQRDPADGRRRVDEEDADQVEEEMHHRQLEAPVRVGSGDRKGRQERRHRGSHVGAEGDREGVVQEQQTGSRQGDQHRGGYRAGLNEDGDDRAHAHGDEGAAPEDAPEGRFAPAGGNPLEGAYEQTQGNHQQHDRERRQDGGRGLVRTRDRGGEPLDRSRNHLDDPLEGALVVETGPEEAEPLEQPGDQRGGPSEEAGRDLQRQQDRNRQQIEQVVARRHLEGAPELPAVPQMSEGGDRVGDRGADVGPHHHGDGALEREGGLRSGDEAHDERTRDRRTLHQRGGEHPDDQSQEGISRGLEELIEEPGPEPLEALAQAVDRPQEEDEQQDQAGEPGKLAEHAPGPVRPANRHSLLPSDGHGHRRGAIAGATGGTVEFRFEMDE